MEMNISSLQTLGCWSHAEFYQDWDPIDLS